MIVNKITNSSLSIKAPAKINLFLEVLNKRPDGFHNINSVFQAVSLFDELEFCLADEPSVRIKILNDIDLDTNDDNLIVKAFSLMKNKFNINQGLTVNLIKNIPIAAGLGGGSADAAATLKACNILYNIGLSNDNLARLGAQIGSDIPFFFTKGQAKVTGRGEIIEKIKIPTDYYIVLVNPRYAISTPESYSNLKRSLTNSKLPFNLAECRNIKELLSQLTKTGNDFESFAFNSHPDLMRVKALISKSGAELVRMSGSGPTLFGLHKSKPDLIRTGFVNDQNWLVFTVKPVIF